MNNVQRRKLNQAQAETAFMIDNAADFPADSPGGKTAKLLEEQLANAATLAGEQTSQAARAHVGVKNDLLADLDSWLRKINRAAVALDDEIPGIRNLFRMPRNQSQANRLATARNFQTTSAAYQEQFENYDLPADFRRTGMTLIEEIEAKRSAAHTSQEKTGGATGGLTVAFREIGKLLNKLNAIVKNKYAGDPQKLAAWAIASHLEAAPKNAAPPAAETQ